MAVKLFLADNRSYTDDDLRASLQGLRLKGRNVLLYSRLLSFGRMLTPETPSRILQIVMEEIDPTGTLCIPCYTFSAYRGEVFDPAHSKSRVGILGEVARATPGFVRTIHPVYSTSCWGRRVRLLSRQDPRSCFGSGSFFDLFTQLSDPYIVMLGTNLSAVTLAHYYDQMFKAPGRFLKIFRGKIAKSNETVEIEFDAFVRDYDYYRERVPCLGRLDALAERLGMVNREECLGSWCHGIRERDLRRLYRACIEVDAEYFLSSSLEEFEDYYEKNEFRLFAGDISPDRIEAIRANLDLVVQAS